MLTLVILVKSAKLLWWFEWLVICSWNFHLQFCVRVVSEGLVQLKKCLNSVIKCITVFY